MKYTLYLVVVILLGCQGYIDETDQLKQPVESNNYTILASYDLDIPNNSAEVVEVRIRNHNYMLFFSYNKGGMCHSEDCPCRLKFNK